MKQYKVKNGCELRRNGVILKEGARVVLDEKEALALSSVGIISLEQEEKAEVKEEKPEPKPEPVVEKSEPVKSVPKKKTTAKKKTTKKKEK